MAQQLGIKVKVDYPTASEIESQFAEATSGANPKLKVDIDVDGDSLKTLKEKVNGITGGDNKINLTGNFNSVIKDLGTISAKINAIQKDAAKGIDLKLNTTGIGDAKGAIQKATKVGDLKGLSDIQKEISDIQRASSNASGDDLAKMAQRTRVLTDQLESAAKSYEKLHGENPLKMGNASSELEKVNEELDQQITSKQRLLGVNKQTAIAMRELVRLENQVTSEEKKLARGTGSEETATIKARINLLNMEKEALTRNANLDKKMSGTQREALEYLRTMNRLSVSQIEAKQKDAAAAKAEANAYKELKNDLREVAQLRNEIARLDAKGGSDGSGLTSKETDNLKYLQQQKRALEQINEIQNKPKRDGLSQSYKESLAVLEKQYSAQEKIASAKGKEQGEIARSNSLYRELSASVSKVASEKRRAATAGNAEKRTIQESIAGEERIQSAIRQKLQAQNLVNAAREREVSKIREAGEAEARSARATSSARQTDKRVSSLNSSSSRGIMPTVDLMNVAYGARDAAGLVVSSVGDIDKAITSVTKVVDAPAAQLKKFRESIYDTASGVGKSAVEYATSVERWASAGKNLKQSVELSKISTIGAFVGNIEEGDMVDYMSVPLNAWKREGLKAKDVINSMNEVANKNAIEMDDLGEAYQRAATTAANSGTSFAQMTGMISGAQEATRAGGEKIGTALRAIDVNYGKISTRLTKGDSQKYDFFEGLGVHIKDSNGQLRSTYDINKDLAGQWQTMSKEHKSIAAFYASGKQHSAVFTGMMDNWAKVEKAAGQAQHQVNLFDKNSGSAYQEFARQKNTVAFALAQVKNNFDKLINTATGGKDGVNLMLQRVAKALDLVNEKASDKGFMQFIGKLARGAGLLAFADIATKAMGRVKNSLSDMKTRFLTGFNMKQSAVSFVPVERALDRISASADKASAKFDKLAAAERRAGTSGSLSRSATLRGPITPKKISSKVHLTSNAKEVANDVDKVGDAAKRGTVHVKTMDSAGNFSKTKIGTHSAEKGFVRTAEAADKTAAKSATAGAKLASGLGKGVSIAGHLVQGLMHVIPYLDIIAIGMDALDLIGVDVWGGIGKMISKVTNHTDEAKKAMKEYGDVEKQVRKDLLDSGLTNGDMKETRTYAENNNKLVDQAHKQTQEFNAANGTNTSDFYTPDQFKTVAGNMRNELSTLNAEAKKFGMKKVKMDFSVNDFDTVKSQMEQIEALRQKISTKEANSYASNINKAGSKTTSLDQILKDSSKSSSFKAQIDELEKKIAVADKNQDWKGSRKYAKQLEELKNYWSSAEAIDSVFASKVYRNQAKEWNKSVQAIKDSRQDLMANLSELDTSQVSKKNSKYLSGDIMMGAQEQKATGRTAKSLSDKIAAEGKLTPEELDRYQKLAKAAGVEIDKGLSTNTQSWSQAQREQAAFLQETEKNVEKQKELAKTKFDELLNKSGMSDKDKKLADEAFDQGGTALIKYMGKLGQNGQKLLGMSRQTIDQMGKGWSSELTKMQADAEKIEKTPTTKQVNFKLIDEGTGLIDQKILTSLYKIPKQKLTTWGLANKDGSLNMGAVNGLLNSIPKEKMTAWGLMKADGSLNEANLKALVEGIPKKKLTQWGVVKDGQFNQSGFEQLLNSIPDKKLTKWGIVQDGKLDAKQLDKWMSIPKDDVKNMHVKVEKDGSYDIGEVMDFMEKNPKNKTVKAVIKYLNDPKTDPTKKTIKQPAELVFKIDTSGKDKKASKKVKGQINVTADVKDASAKINKVAKNKKSKVTVTASTGSADKSIEKLTKGKKSKIKVTADTSSATKSINKLVNGSGSKGRVLKLKVDANSSSANKEINKLVNGSSSKGRVLKLKVSVDDKSASTAIRNIGKGKKVKVNVTANTNAASRSINSLGRSKKIKIPVTANTSSASRSINSLGKSNRVKVTVTANTSAASSAISKVARNKSVKINVSLNGGGAISQARSAMNSIRNKTATVTMKVTGNVAGRVAAAKAQVQSLNGTSGTAKLKASNGSLINKVASSRAKVLSLNGVSSTSRMEGDNSNLSSKVGSAKAKIRSVPSSHSTDFKATMSGSWGTVEKYLNMSSHTIHVNANVTHTVHEKKAKAGKSVSISGGDVTNASVAGVVSQSVAIGDAVASAAQANGLPTGRGFTSNSESDDTDKDYKASEDIWRYWSHEQYEGKDIEATIANLENSVTQAKDDLNRVVSLHRQQISLLNKQLAWNQNEKNAKQGEMDSILSQLGGYGFSHNGNQITNFGRVTQLSGPDQHKAEDLLNRWKQVYDDISAVNDKMREINQQKWDLQNDIAEKTKEIEDKNLDNWLKREGLKTQVATNNMHLIETRLANIGEKDYFLRANALNDGIKTAGTSINSLIAQYNSLATAQYRDGEAADKASSQLDSLKTEILGNADAAIKYRDGLNSIPINRLTEDMSKFNDVMKKQGDSISNNIGSLKEGLLSGTTLSDLQSAILPDLDFTGRDVYQRQYEERLQLERDLDSRLQNFAKEQVMREAQIANDTLEINQSKYQQLLKMSSDYKSGVIDEAYKVSASAYKTLNEAVGRTNDGEISSYTNTELEDKLAATTNSIAAQMSKMLAQYEALKGQSTSRAELEKINSSMILDQIKLQEKAYQAVIDNSTAAIAKAKTLLGNTQLSAEQRESLKSAINDYQTAISDAQASIKEAVKSRYEYEFNQLDKLAEEYKKATSLIGAFKDMASTLNMNSSETEGLFDAYFDAKEAELKANEQAYQNLKNEQSTKDYGSLEWNQLKTKMKEISDNVDTLTGELLTANKERLENQLESVKKTVQRGLLGGLTEDEYKNYQDLWMRNVEKEIQVEDLKKKAADLEANNISDRLKQIDRQEKLSRSESDYLAKQLNVIDLQRKVSELMTDKKVKTIGKNAQGEWDWNYSVDATELDKNITDLHTAQQELAKYREQARGEYVTKLDSIIDKAKSGGLSREELQNQIGDLNSSYAPVLQDIPDMNFANVDDIVKTYGDYVDANKDILNNYQESTDGGQQNQFQQLISGFGEQFKLVSKDMGAIFGQEFRNILSGANLNGVPLAGTAKSESVVIQNQTLAFPSVTDTTGFEDAIQNLPQTILQKVNGK